MSIFYLRLKKVLAEKTNYFVLLFCFLFIFVFGCQTKRQLILKSNSEMPPKILWAWERHEDLRFLDTNKYGVAFLAQTLILENNDVIFRPRRQPFEIAPNAYLIAVTRIETNKRSSNHPALSEAQNEATISFIKKTLELPSVKAIQIDFDAVVSERNFYKNLIVNLRKQLPENTPLTITALASWCVGDAWFGDFPIDEAVPMAFEMGADTSQVRDFLSNETDWREPLCRGSYGISINESLEVNFKTNRRFFYFNSRAWKESDLQKLGE
jgi:hypothetical protein